jgi:hypothetical protein
MTASATEGLTEGRDLQAKGVSRGTRRAQTAATAERPRFFLAKPGGSSASPELGKEMSGEAEAIVESLKTGLHYFLVTEWRGVADLSGRKPQLAREAARGFSKGE